MQQTFLPVIRGFVDLRRAYREAMRVVEVPDTWLAVDKSPSCYGGVLAQNTACFALGCTDLLAENFDGNATKDDGSCRYTCERLASVFAPDVLDLATVRGYHERTALPFWHWYRTPHLQLKLPPLSLCECFRSGHELRRGGPVWA